jgi:hypothetical protein
VCVSLGLDAGGESIPYVARRGEDGAPDAIRNYAHTIDAIARQLEDALAAGAPAAAPDTTRVLPAPVPGGRALGPEVREGGRQALEDHIPDTEARFSAQASHDSARRSWRSRSAPATRPTTVSPSWKPALSHVGGSRS